MYAESYTGEWLHFELIGRKPKTLVWSVASRTNGTTQLGTVGWFGQWRNYAFFPNENEQLVFDKNCLREIADFCERKSREHRAQ